MWLGDVMVRGMTGWGRARVDEARDMDVTGVTGGGKARERAWARIWLRWVCQGCGCDWGCYG